MQALLHVGLTGAAGEEEEREVEGASEGQVKRARLEVLFYLFCFLFNFLFSYLFYLLFYLLFFYLLSSSFHSILSLSMRLRVLAKGEAAKAKAAEDEEGKAERDVTTLEWSRDGAVLATGDPSPSSHTHTTDCQSK